MQSLHSFSAILSRFSPQSQLLSHGETFCPPSRADASNHKPFAVPSMLSPLHCKYVFAKSLPAQSGELYPKNTIARVSNPPSSGLRTPYGSARITRDARLDACAISNASAPHSHPPTDFAPATSFFFSASTCSVATSKSYPLVTEQQSVHRIELLQNPYWFSHEPGRLYG